MIMSQVLPYISGLFPTVKLVMVGTQSNYTPFKDGKARFLKLKKGFLPLSRFQLLKLHSSFPAKDQESLFAKKCVESQLLAFASDNSLYYTIQHNLLKCQQ